MSAIENNEAAWFTAAKTPFEVGPGPDQSKVVEDEIIVKVAAVAINPSEWKVSTKLKQVVMKLIRPASSKIIHTYQSSSLMS
jgi:NADPH:quinone reductase-like Zn-dependent oxidoreductase